MIKCPQENILRHGSVSEMRCAACEQRINCAILPAKKQLSDNIRDYFRRAQEKKEEEAQKKSVATTFVLLHKLRHKFNVEAYDKEEWEELERHILGLENLAQEAHKQFPYVNLISGQERRMGLWKALQALDQVRQSPAPPQVENNSVNKRLTDAELFMELEEWAEHKSDFRISTEYTRGLPPIYDAMWPRFRNFDKAFRLLVKCCDLEYKYERDSEGKWFLRQVAAVSISP